ncbi:MULTISPECIES: 5-histidylcysteine sulfoxide synthase [unclassified Okeania]|uniref:5-histidylcysteine sulfoxide synthase n=1 Tax=unclassified Okeania TaxID=2634635 RepID=UPI0013B7EC46|nr:MULTISPECIES: 5-histidylcysteine sulfoxide synthase [unclassified Okeania]NES76899.1 5-histidylcysteine sulfoxide synthase [Okeania sp. SIO1H4]NET20528.1 5-histidylcysteine sulfoxide synthase [Okeania sp. SIO1H5]NET93695.1 5-histidylcysteine sulfoxide synthase [Okeania sp. SIO1H2]
MTLTRNPNLDLTTLFSPEQKGEKDQTDPLIDPCPDWWWTGLRPTEVLKALPIPNLATCTRREVLDYFDNGWLMTEVLLSALQGEQAFLDPPYHQLRHPLIFYLCHPAVLYINKLRLAGLIHESINPYFEQLFETGVDEMSWDDMSKNEMDWPSVREVVEYRRSTYKIIRELIETLPDLEDSHPPIAMDNPAWALFLGFEHERIHIETSSVLLRELPLSVLRRPEAWPNLHPSAFAESHTVENELIAISSKTVTLGKPWREPYFGWDNEYGSRQVRVRSFQASQYLVTNREFYEFVVAGGYQESKYWTEEGWAWRQNRNTKWPTFWVADGPAGLHQYRLRTIFEVVEMPWSWPVGVNWYEAKAYCAWKTEQDNSPAPYRLLTEAEHHCLRRGNPPVNLNLTWGSETPVNALPANEAGFYDVFGNVWHWCEDDFNPLEGFRVHRIYDDFSTPCFDGEHKMILGGSFISTGDEATQWARFHFRCHFFQHAGFRLVRSDDGDASCDAVLISSQSNGVKAYEGEKILAENLMLHYEFADEVMPYNFGPKNAVGFPQRIAQLTLETADRLGIKKDRAIDVGCSVGGSTFELARGCESVLGIDLSVTFIEAAETLRRKGRLAYSRRDEGENTSQAEVCLPEDLDRRIVNFRRADACALPPELVGFDVVLAANLICRLPSPRGFLGRLCGARGLVRPGGLLVLATPFTWDERFTPRDAWLGGHDGEDSLTVLQGELNQDFELLDTQDMPFLIREHARKFQYVVSLVSLWKRRSD